MHGQYALPSLVEAAVLAVYFVAALPAFLPAGLYELHFETAEGAGHKITRYVPVRLSHISA